MPPESNAKGDRRERELVNRLDELGFAVMRAPASGSATSRELPDVLAGLDGIFFAIEVKSSASDPIYLSGEEVEALIHFSQNFGAKPRIGVRFDQEEWYFFHPHDVFYTDGGNFRVKKELALEQGEVITDLLEAEPSEDNREETLEKVLRAVEGGHLTVEDAIEML